MAQVLAAGGFPEEARPQLAKAIGHGAAIRLAALGELPADATLATPAQIRDLVERKALSLQATARLDELAATFGAPTAAEIGRLLEATANVVAGCVEDAS